jgi:YD repeat-containing protein
MKKHFPIRVLTLVLCLNVRTGMSAVTYQYDDLHQLVRVTYDNGSAIVYEYDAVGNRTLRVINGIAGTGYLEVGVDPPLSGTVQRNPDVSWDPVGSPVVLAAVSTGTCHFVIWTGDVPLGHEHDNPLTVMMSTYGYLSLTAHFDSAVGHMGEDCNRNDVPDGCEWADTNANGYLDACETRGDLNCDGSVSFKDINPFVLYLSNPSAWQAANPGCPAANGDINGDGTYPSFGDINPFVALLSGGG